jgi:hypothetical protein
VTLTEVSITCPSEIMLPRSPSDGAVSTSRDILPGEINSAFGDPLAEFGVTVHDFIKDSGKNGN